MTPAAFNPDNGRKFSRPAAVILAILLQLAAFGLEAAPLKITIASDSTAAAFPTNDYGSRIGWGQVLSNFFTTNVVVDDRASSGRSSKSFYDEGLWTNCLKSPADFYFIQFGHNDDKPTDPTRYTNPSNSFKVYLSNYVNEARASNGIPVFLTPPTRRNYSSAHAVKLDNLQYYSQAMRELGAVMSVPVLDAYPASVDFYGFVGSNSAPFYQAKTDTNDTLNQDRTHFNQFGASQHCYLIMDCLLNSTNASLLPLQNAVRKKGVNLHVELPAARTVQFQGSTNLLDWQNYGTAHTSAPPAIERYFYDVRAGRMFFRAGTN
jgi:lysophospholipase L1-like esterase